MSISVFFRFLVGSRLQEGWVDFLAPQLYWRIDPPQQSYPVLLDWWVEQNTGGRHIYAATALYQIDDSEQNWPTSELTDQVRAAAFPIHDEK